MAFMGLTLPVLFPLIGAIIALVHIRWKHHASAKGFKSFLMRQLTIGLGIGDKYVGFRQCVFPDQVAARIGRPP